LNSWISKVGFHNKKAEYIKKTTEIIKNKHKGKVPEKFEDIIDLPGVGPKMAHLLLQIAFGRTEGISVDTHVHRISNRLKWVKKSTNTPE
jgi:endonuclease-3